MNFAVWSVKKSEEQKPKYWNPYNLLADRKTFGVVMYMEYYYKLLCEFISDGDFTLFKKLYEDTNESEVWDYMAIRKAVTY